MNQYDNCGRVSLWKPNQKSDKSPILSGSVIAHRDIREGEALDIALWKNSSTNERAPTLTGKIQDKRDPMDNARSSQQSSPPPRDDFDDDIPF